MGWWRPGGATSVLLIAAAAASAGAALGMAQRPTAVSPAVATATSATVESQIEVHVAGWVAAPGVVLLPDHSIVADAVAAAGGLRPGARADLINLAAPLRSGDQIVVPGPEAGPTASGAGDGLVSINHATAAELQSLPGVGPVLAERIVAHRDQIGGFDRVEDLLQVPGIGESKLSAIRDLVRVP